MAKIEIVHGGEDDDPEVRESVEVRFWGLGGREEQLFLIGSGMNCSAKMNAWIEISYTFNGAQIFYTRNFINLFDEFNASKAENFLDEIVTKGEGSIGFGDMLPESSVRLKLESGSYEDANGQQQQYSICELDVSADVGAVIGNSSPGTRMIKISLGSLKTEDGVRFIRELIHELDDAQNGKHPDPGRLPHGSSEWPFVRQLNQRAYDNLSTDYQEKYFEHPRITQVFDDWLAQLPAGGRVLDVGCGHGQPVIGRLLEKGMQVTGVDFSPAMLARAREQFPQVTFLNKVTPEIDFEQEFDGACSFSSTLYLDPVDLFHSIYRLYHALKPGGLLFLYCYDLHPAWRGTPADTVMNQWMWSWTYSKEEASQALSEHGYFEVLSVCDVTTAEEREARRARIQAEMEEERKKAEQKAAEAGNSLFTPFPAFPAYEIPQVEEEPVQADILAASSVSADQPDESGDSDVPEVDLSHFPMPHFPGPDESIAYHYVVIAQRKG